MPTIERHGCVTVLRPEGPIRHDSIEFYSETIQGQLSGGVPMFVLDLSSAPLIDGAGLEWMLDLSDQCSQRGGCLRLCSVGELCHDLLRITGVHESIEEFADLTEALASFA